MALRLTAKDWMYCRRLGCQLSYAAYHALYAEQRDNIEVVVSAWCKHFMKESKQ